MIRSFTDAYKEAIASASSDATLISSVVMTHNVFPAPIRFAQCEYDILLGGDIYLGKQFTYSQPAVSANSNTSLGISISNISGVAISYIDQTLESLEPVLLKFSVWILGENGPQAGFDNELEVVNFSIKGNDLSISASYPDLVNLKLPRVLYTTKEFPGLR